ncbi:MAG: AbrB/MazE/SpoVT family DNA-binding domain-containing protein [Lachnospiraceae bacterium]|nr:AbrB/MazE/SpoVT family DNA-binding domain-containing protein [Lachnospiraceae bacterium]
MRNTGIIRNLDNLGRIVIPKEMRRVLGIEEKDPIEILIQDETIVLRKYEPADIFNGDKDNLIDYCGKKVSKASVMEMAKIAGIID